MTEKLIKEAGVLRTRLQNGSLNIHELSNFLAKVEACASPLKGRSEKKSSRLSFYLDSLERKRALKPSFNKKAQ